MSSSSSSFSSAMDSLGTYAVSAGKTNVRLGFVLRTVVPIHSRHCLPAIPSLPDHCTHISDNERLLLSWIQHRPGEQLPSTRLFSAPRAIQWPQPVILRCVVAMFAMSLSIHRFITGRGITQGPPTPSLYWFSATHMQGRTPPLFFAQMGECIFDPPDSDPPPPYSHHGRVVWSMEYWDPSRHLSLWLDTKLPIRHRKAALQLVMKRALSLVDPRPPQCSDQALYLLEKPTGSPLHHPVPILSTRLHVQVPQAIRVKLRDHQIPHILGEEEVANRPQTFVEDGVLHVPHRPGNGGCRHV